MSRISGNRKQIGAIPTVIGAGITEQYYFQHISHCTEFVFRIRPRFFGTESIYKLVKKIDKVISDGGVAVCVFDADIARNNDVERVKLERFCKKYSKKKNVILCDSLPSIEYWFLLHFCKTNKYYKDSDSVQRTLRKFIPSYEKKEVFFKTVKWVDDMCSDGKMEKAIANAKQFGTKGLSYSNVYKAFEKQLK